MSKPDDATFWCLVLFAFFLMARKSNLVPDTVSRFSPGKQLCRNDVRNLDGYLLVTIKWSKTIQFGERVLRIPVLAIPNSILCPVHAYIHMCKLVPGRGEWPLFLTKEGRYLVPITYSQLHAGLKKLVAATGREPSLYSSHSFRRAGASWALRARVPSELIQLHGDWRSDAYKAYLKFSLEVKLVVGERMRSLICARCPSHDS